MTDIKIGAKLKSILNKLDEEENDYVAYEMLWLADPNAYFHNGLKIELVDVSKLKGFFTVKIDGKFSFMKIVKFIEFFFKGILTDEDTNTFMEKYDKLANKVSSENPKEPLIKRTEITPRPFKYDPNDIKNTFISLVTKTYPHGHEDEILKFLPKLDKDEVGNYYKIIGGNPETMFCCHLDTADRVQSPVNLFSTIEGKDEFIMTDGKTILGADDKAGTAVMLYMMEHKVPGLYYFFIGEERGGLGSHALDKNFDKIDYLKNLKRCIAFDRRDTRSVITKQLSSACCSDKFGEALCSAYNKQGLNLFVDPTGVYTDSASFVDDIPECTNVSVGYYKEHTSTERQNITYLEQLAKASVEIDWNSLPTERKCGIDEYTLRKYGNFISELKSAPFSLEIKIVNSFYGGTSIQCDLEYGFIDETYESLVMLQELLVKYKIPQSVRFDGEFIKIDLV